jgi:hypothetical protein
LRELKYAIDVRKLSLIGRNIQYESTLTNFDISRYFLSHARVTTDQVGAEGFVIEKGHQPIRIRCSDGLFAHR